jgi:hypothetical protein
MPENPNFTKSNQNDSVPDQCPPLELAFPEFATSPHSSARIALSISLLPRLKYPFNFSTTRSPSTFPSTGEAPGPRLLFSMTPEVVAPSPSPPSFGPNHAVLKGLYQLPHPRNRFMLRWIMCEAIHELGNTATSWRPL